MVVKTRGDKKTERENEEPDHSPFFSSIILSQAKVMMEKVWWEIPTHLCPCCFLFVI